MKLLLSLVLLACASIDKEFANAQCDSSNYIYSADGNFALVNCGFDSWVEANDYCFTAFGTTLATDVSVTTSASLQELCDQQTVYSGTNMWCYFGAYGIISNTSWSWADGTNVTSRSYSNWISGEPHGSGGNFECGLFGRITSSGEWGWADGICNVAGLVPITALCKIFDVGATTDEPTDEPTLPTRTIANDDNVCDSNDYTYSTDGKFILVDCEFYGWEEANDYCVNTFGTTLATDSSSSDSNSLAQLCNQQTVYIIEVFFDLWCYFGLYNVSSGTDWLWIDGTPVTSTSYSNWVTGEPHANNADYSCGLFGHETNSTEWGWADGICGIPGLPMSALCSSGLTAQPRTTEAIMTTDGMTTQAITTQVVTQQTMTIHPTTTEAATNTEATNTFATNHPAGCDSANYTISSDGKFVLVDCAFDGWSEANDYCQSAFGTTLATDGSSSDSDSLMEICVEQTVHIDTNLWCYFGAYDITSNTSWSWADGTIVTSSSYSNWVDSEPHIDIASYSCGLFGRITSSGQWGWADGVCNIITSPISALCSSGSTAQPATAQPGTAQPATTMQSTATETIMTTQATTSQQGTTTQGTITTQATTKKTTTEAILTTKAMTTQARTESTTSSTWEATATEPETTEGERETPESTNSETSKATLTSCDSSDYTYSSNGKFILVDCAFNSWDESNFYCQETFGTSLATDDSSSDSSSLAEICDQETVYTGSNRYCYFGAYDIDNETDWDWIDGTSVTSNSKRNWLPNEPHGSGSPVSGSPGWDCGLFGYSTTYDVWGWAAGACNGFSMSALCSSSDGTTHEPKLIKTTEDVADGTIGIGNMNNYYCIIIVVMAMFVILF